VRYDATLTEIVQAAVSLNQVGDHVMSTLEAIERRLRKGGVTTEAWLDETPVTYEGRKWSLGFARFDGRYRLAVREVTTSQEPGYSTPLKHSPRLLRLRAAASVGGLLGKLQTAIQAQVDEAVAAAKSAEAALAAGEGILSDAAAEKGADNS